MAKLKNTTCIDVNATSSNSFPIGSIIKWYKSDVPNDTWKICDGSLISKDIYSSLWAILGDHRFGGGNLDEFRIPDLQVRFTRGASSGTLYASGGQILHRHSLGTHNHTQAHAHNMSHSHTGTHTHSANHSHTLGSHNHSTSHYHTQSHSHTADASYGPFFNIASHFWPDIFIASENHEHSDTTSTNNSDTGSTSGAMDTNNAASSNSTPSTSNNNVTVSLATNNNATSGASNTTSGDSSMYSSYSVGAPYRALYYIIKVL